MERSALSFPMTVLKVLEDYQIAIKHFFYG